MKEAKVPSPKTAKAKTGPTKEKAMEKPKKEAEWSGQARCRR